MRLENEDFWSLEDGFPFARLHFSKVLSLTFFFGGGKYMHPMKKMGRHFLNLSGPGQVVTWNAEGQKKLQGFQHLP